jgi:hypothetical protein
MTYFVISKIKILDIFKIFCKKFFSQCWNFEPEIKNPFKFGNSVNISNGIKSIFGLLKRKTAAVSILFSIEPEKLNFSFLTDDGKSSLLSVQYLNVGHKLKELAPYSQSNSVPITLFLFSRQKTKSIKLGKK